MAVAADSWDPVGHVQTAEVVTPQEESYDKDNQVQSLKVMLCDYSQTILLLEAKHQMELRWGGTLL